MYEKMILKTLKKSDLGEKIFLAVIGLSILFVSGEKYFLHRHNLKRYLDGFT